MNRLVFLIITVLWLIGFSDTSLVLAQDRPIKLLGEAIAYDAFSPLLNITSASQIQTFIVKIDQILKGEVNSRYIIVKHETFEEENALLKQVLKGKIKVEFRLNREKNCDSSLENLQEIRIQGQSTNSTNESRIKWINQNEAISGSTYLPCYKLENEDFTYVNDGITGQFVAYDKFAGLTDSHQPSQVLIIRIQDKENLQKSRLIKAIYYPDTNGYRGGAKFLLAEILTYNNLWNIKLRQPQRDERTNCVKSNFLKTFDDEIDTNDKNESTLRFSSTKDKKDIKIKNLNQLPCMVLDSLILAHESAGTVK